ncbi:hypothetical protein BLD44_024125 [Mastigocladus laminosus UU774]|nr:hypothetical protein B4U84_07770 [Westiellopsis prolifica IICB1]TFI51819.1 hypothetical protein BLD44_024125 [Mastigocladus laminosus UU774]
MIEFVLLAGAALVMINQASPQARHQRQIKAYKEGKISSKQAQENIQKIWMNPYWNENPNDFSEIERTQANWNAYVKKSREEQNKFNSLDVNSKAEYFSDRVKAKFAKGEIDRNTASNQLAEIKRWRRNSLKS